MESVEEAKLRQLFKNNSNCYADIDDVIQAMDENCFVESVKEWQADRMYSEDEVLNFYDWLETSDEINKFWRKNRMTPTMAIEIVETWEKSYKQVEELPTAPDKFQQVIELIEKQIDNIQVCINQSIENEDLMDKAYYSTSFRDFNKLLDKIKQL